MVLIGLFACTRLCESGEVTTAGTGAELFDVDGDGFAEVTGACGPVGGAFAERRPVVDSTTLILPGDRDASGRIDFALTTYVLASASVTFLTTHMEPGTTLGMDALTGFGLHLPTGEPYDLYATYPLTDGSITFLDRREVRGSRASVALDGDELEDVLMRWSFEFSGAQSWEGEDWVGVSTNASDLLLPDLPPDHSFFAGR
jgi:hypothetical protein